MSIVGAYEEEGLVVIEFDNAEPTRITWKEAMKRCQAVAKSEASVAQGRREPGIQKAIEEIIGAAAKARKKTDGSWTPPKSVSGYQPGDRDRIRLKRHAVSSKLILPP
jgi:hypothetical protein